MIYLKHNSGSIYQLGPVDKYGYHELEYIYQTVPNKLKKFPFQAKQLKNTLEFKQAIKLTFEELIQEVKTLLEKKENEELITLTPEITKELNKQFREIVQEAENKINKVFVEKQSIKTLTDEIPSAIDVKISDSFFVDSEQDEIEW